MRTNLLCLIVCALVNCVQCVLDVSCNYVTQDRKINCRCYSTSSSNEWEYLATIIGNYVSNRQVFNIDFTHVVLRDCNNVMIEVDYGSLSELSTQKVSYVSFLEIDTLHLYLSNLDPGVKTIVTEDIQNLKVSGRLDQTSASMRFFLRNTRVNNGDIIFDDFYTTTPVSLMNIQVRTLPCYVNDKCMYVICTIGRFCQIKSILLTQHHHR